MRSFRYYTASGVKLPLRSPTRTLSFSLERAFHSRTCRVLDILCLSRYTLSFLLSFYTRFSGTSVPPLIVRSAGLWRMTRSFFFSTTRSPIILLDAFDRSFYCLLFFFYLSFTAPPCLVSAWPSSVLCPSRGRYLHLPFVSCLLQHRRATRRLKMLIHRTWNGDAIYTIGLLYGCLQVDKMSLITAAWQMPFTMWSAKSSIAGDHGLFFDDVASASTSQFARITKSR